MICGICRSCDRWSAESAADIINNLSHLPADLKGIADDLLFQLCFRSSLACYWLNQLKKRWNIWKVKNCFFLLKVQTESSLLFQTVNWYKFLKESSTASSTIFQKQFIIKMFVSRKNILQEIFVIVIIFSSDEWKYFPALLSSSVY